MWKYKTPGIPDSEFERLGGIPMTKEEIRAIQIGKARLGSGDVVYDIGCGSGSVSVEAALQVGDAGMVYAVDFDPRAIGLTRRNLERFGVRNASVVLGNAREKIPGLPQADAVFIGGTGGDTGEIIGLCGDKLRGGGRVVIGVILIETLFSVIKALEGAEFSSVDIVQITVSKSKKTSTGTMMLARNPVTVVSATRG